MGRLKSSVKHGVRGAARMLPHGVKRFIRNVFAELSGTREMRDFFRQSYGDYKVYEQLLKNKSDLTEYHVDKIIRSLGDQLNDVRTEHAALLRRVQMLEQFEEGRDRKNERVKSK